MNNESEIAFHRPPTPIMKTISPSVPDLSLLDNTRLSYSFGQDSPRNIQENSKIFKSGPFEHSFQLSKLPDSFRSSDTASTVTKRTENGKDPRSGLKSKIISVIADQNKQLLQLQKQILNLLEAQRIQPDDQSSKSDTSTQTSFTAPLSHDVSSNTSFSWPLLQNSMKTLSDASVQTGDSPCENTKTVLQSSGEIFSDPKPISSAEETLSTISIDSSDLPSLSQWPDDDSTCDHSDLSNFKVMIDRINGILKKDDMEQRKRILSVKEATINQLQKLGVHLNSQNSLDEAARAINHLVNPAVNYVSIMACASEDNGTDFNTWTWKYHSNKDFLHNTGSDARNLAVKTSQVCIQDASHMTMYGMQPSNLSFATRKYLEKYGLLPGTSVERTTTSQFYSKPLPKPFNYGKYKETVSTTNILDVDHIRNQPKLL